MSTTQSYSRGELSSSHQEYDLEATFTQEHYAREMFNHTKKQMDAATTLAARRRSPNAHGTNAHATLNGDQTSISTFSVTTRYCRQEYPLTSSTTASLRSWLHAQPDFFQENSSLNEIPGNDHLHNDRSSNGSSTLNIYNDRRHTSLPKSRQ
ncbi:hypothetical protein BDZ45DRAFT_744346 [Acephala macrosclerotiorum]|nr:hypothetical protein BDZ45DRAFT_744346 [Acephala macrosclerotiorum]